MDFQEQPLNGQEKEASETQREKTTDNNEEQPLDAEKTPKGEKNTRYGVFASIVCIAVAITVLLTYTVASAVMRRRYVNDLLAKQQEIELLKQSNLHPELSIISALLERYSYYADEMSEQEMVNAAIKAYVAATGDRYAAYYTNLEYAALGETVEYAGIGAGTIQSKQEYMGAEYFGYEITYFYKDSPALAAGMRVGDFIYTIKHNGEFRTVEQLGGYEKAIEHIRGEAGSVIEVQVLRESDASVWEKHTFSITRAVIKNPSVTYDLRENDPTTARVFIHRFDVETPMLFKNAVNTLRKAGVSHFVFDLRDNPGGDLLSIKAVLSYFLEEGDTVLKSIDRNGAVETEYIVEVMQHTDRYAPCSVAKGEIGMYRDLDMVVICNGNTASAAEVFTATMRDYQLAPIVGETTFGKGIMQMVFDLSTVGNYSGYLKLTTHAYVTKCGETYHEIGVSPSEGLAVKLSEEAAKYGLQGLPQSMDAQLQLAFSQFTP